MACGVGGVMWHHSQLVKTDKKQTYEMVKGKGKTKTHTHTQIPFYKWDSSVCVCM